MLTIFGQDGVMRYVPELDGLRAIAVVAVVLFHSAPNGPVSGGFLGVDLFFVLSGYLITSILADEWRRAGSVDLLRFYWHRLLRLMPALLFMLSAYMLAAPALWPGHDHTRDALLTAVYASDYSYSYWRLPLYLQHSWSLAVEEHFYLVWPVALGWLLAARRPLLWLAAVYAAVLLWRSGFDAWTDYYYRFDTRATGLIVGAMLAFHMPRLTPLSAWGAFFGFAALAMVAHIDAARTFIPFAETASAALVACAVTGNCGSLDRILRHPAMVAVGRLSYAIYLWHFPFAYAVRGSLGFATTAVVTLAFSVAMAAISYVSVEALGRSLKRAMLVHNARRAGCRVRRSDPLPRSRSDQSPPAMTGDPA